MIELYVKKEVKCERGKEKFEGISPRISDADAQTYRNIALHIVNVYDYPSMG